MKTTGPGEGKRYAILGDIHGNLEALTAVLADAGAQGVTDYACLGDIVGYNPNPAECVDTVRELGCISVTGNHDHHCVHPEARQDLNEVAAAALAWTREQLTDAHLAYLANLPMSVATPDMELVHGTLDPSDPWGYVFGVLDAMASFAHQKRAVCFHGHTHVPIAFVEDAAIRVQLFSRTRIAAHRRYFLNVGSVGQPRDGDTRAAYAIYDVTSAVAELRRVRYPVSVTQAKILKAGLPKPLALRLALGV